MHYYQHHIGDFIKDTSFLSNEEVGIYLKLLWLYYDTEQPLENNAFSLAIKTNARGKEPVVNAILEMFFELTDGSWHQSRVDAELAKYKRMSEGGKRGADKRWHAGNDSPPIATLSPPLCTPNANHKPTTINQQPIKQTTKQPVGVCDSVWGDFVVLRRQKKAAITDTVMKGIAREAAKAGVTLEDALRVCCERNWASFKADWVATKPLQTTAHQASTLAAARSIFGDERSLLNERIITPAPKAIT